MIQCDLIPQLLDDANTVRQQVAKYLQLAENDINSFHDIMSNQIFRDNFVMLDVYVENSSLLID